MFSKKIPAGISRNSREISRGIPTGSLGGIYRGILEELEEPSRNFRKSPGRLHIRISQQFKKIPGGSPLEIQGETTIKSEEKFIEDS